MQGSQQKVEQQVTKGWAEKCLLAIFCLCRNVRRYLCVESGV